MDLEFTGERCVLGLSPPDLVLEHLARYRLAGAYAPGLRVLDAACGSGYGTEALANAGAQFVAGVDISLDSVVFARKNHNAPRTAFTVGDIRTLRFADGAFDLYVSFETIEHVRDGAVCVREAYRALGVGGRYILSTPNRSVTNPGRPLSAQPPNPYHLVEYTKHELLTLLSPYFEVEALYGQCPHSVRGHGWLPMASAGVAAVKALGLHHAPGATRLKPVLQRALPDSTLHPTSREVLPRLLTCRGTWNHNTQPLYLLAVARKR